MQFFSISPNKQMIRVGENTKTAKWYYLTPETPLDGINPGDEVTIKSERRGANNYLTFLAKGEVEAPKNESKKEEKPEEKSDVEVKESSKEEKEPEKKDNDIKIETKIEKVSDNVNVEIGKMVSESLIALQEEVTANNVCDLIDKLYNKYEEKVK